jgi:hypothetical protein
MTEYERFGLVFTKTRVYKFGHSTILYPERPSLDEPAGYEEEEGGEQRHLHPVPAVAGARGAGEYAGSVLLQSKQNIKRIVARIFLKISEIKSVFSEFVSTTKILLSQRCYLRICIEFLTVTFNRIFIWWLF